MIGRAGVSRALVVLRVGKWDIAETIGSGRRHGVDVAYRILENTGSVPETLAAAAPFVADRTVVLGFPDILYEPRDAFAPLLETLDAGDADIVLGLFPTGRADKSDMVELDADGAVRRIWIKSDRRDLDLAWGLAVWRPRFTELLVATAEDPPADLSRSVTGELQVGDVVQLAVDRGWRVETVAFPDGRFLDIGTPDDLAAARDLTAG